MKEKIINEIIQFIKDEVINDHDVTINKDDNIITKGFIDSLGIIRLIAFMKDKYNISDDESNKMILDNFLVLDNFRTVENIAELILNYKKQTI